MCRLASALEQAGNHSFMSGFFVMASAAVRSTLERRQVRFLSAVAVCLLPLAMVVLLPVLLFSKPLTHFVPNSLNDQVSYWRQMTTFHAVGLEGGYYTIDERPAAASFSPFYVHGPVYPMLYGGLGRLTGWYEETGLIYHALFVGAALAFFIWAARPGTLATLLLGALVATTWTLPFYILTLMQESLHHAAAIVFAGIFYRLMTRQQPLSGGVMAVIILFTVFVGFLRVSWMLMLFPLVVLMLSRRTVGRVLAALLAAGVLSAGVYFVSGWLAAPGGSSVEKIINVFRENPSEGWALFSREFINNARIFFSRESWTLEGMQVLQMAGLAGAAVLVIGFALWRRHGLLAALGVLILYALATILALGWGLYLDAGFLRVFNMIVLLCACLLLAFRLYGFVIPLVISSLLVFNSFFPLMQTHATNFRFAPEQIDQWRAETRSVLVYDADAPSAWCNTLYIDVAVYDYRMVVMPPEFGISWFYPNYNFRALKSRYYYTHTYSQITGLTLREDVQFSFGGVLYENPRVRDECLQAPSSSFWEAAAPAAT